MDPRRDNSSGRSMDGREDHKGKALIIIRKVQVGVTSLHRKVMDLPFRRIFLHAKLVERCIEVNDLLSMGACFCCGQMGHKISDCPKKRNDGNGTQDDDSQRKKPRVQGCVFDDRARC